VPQDVEQSAIDGGSEKLTLGLSQDQRADLKRKFSTEPPLNKALRKVRMIAGTSACITWGLPGDWAEGTTGDAGQGTALRYKVFMDEFDCRNPRC